MNVLHPSAKVVFAVLAVLAAAAWNSWAAPPRGKPITINPKVKQAAADDEVPRHGTKVRLSLKDKSRVQGTVVWADEAAGYWMIRTRPGTLPQKVLEKDIAEYQRIRLVNDDGDVLPDEPEIQPVSITNGSLGRVQFYAPTLSTAERSRLSELESAQNDLARARQLMNLYMQSVREELQAIREEVRFQDQRNKLLTQYLMYGMYPSAGYFNPIWGYGGLGGLAFPTYGLASYGVGEMAQGSLANAGRVFETLLAREATLARQISDARQTLAAAQTHARYEGDRLVAVIPDVKGGIRPVSDK